MTTEIIKGPFLGQRHIQTLLLFTGLVANFMIKFNAGVSIVAMTNAATTNPNFAEYNWNQMEKSYIFSSFYWGLVLTQFPAGNICSRFGVKVTLLVATLGSSLISLVVPLTVDWGGWKIYCTTRVIQGMFQGLTLACLHAHLAAWCPVEERNRLGALASSGIECGTVLAVLVGGSIATSSLGWPGIFYIFCGVGVIWCIFWILFAANTPNESTFITEAECNYIESSKNVSKQMKQSDKISSRNIPVPWRAILSSKPFWALLVARCAEILCIDTIQGQLPLYMNGVFGMDMRSNALYSALPFIALWFMAYFYLIMADVLLTHKILSLNVVRKLFNSLAYWIPSMGLIALGFIDAENQTIAVVLMIISVGINAGNMIGSGLNTIDLSPNHAGVLMSLTHASACLWPIVAPISVGAIVTDRSNRLQWQIVFAIIASVVFFGNLIYITFGSTELQEWDDPQYMETKKRQNEKLNAKQSIEKC
ncbi:putative inorganic phosphate cotransporter [Haematobia irritans]|uniref:putative inorganic phosphate cotransporter n=1 Tax=Haematobia irritans TaxID=7368 RepID=UPI003F500D76